MSDLNCSVARFTDKGVEFVSSVRFINDDYGHQVHQLATRLNGVEFDSRVELNTEQTQWSILGRTATDENGEHLSVFLSASSREAVAVAAFVLATDGSCTLSSLLA